jgi:hypothetical protein
VSTIWTPSGEHVPDEGPGGQPSNEDPRSRAGATSAREPGIPASSEGDQRGERDQLAEELERVRAELATTPVIDIVANHAVGLWQLAVLHLTPGGDAPPRLDEARLAIDALGALVDGLGDRFGEHAEPLRDALAQLRVVFVQVQGRNQTS